MNIRIQTWSRIEGNKRTPLKAWSTHEVAEHYQGKINEIKTQHATEIKALELANSQFVMNCYTELVERLNELKKDIEPSKLFFATPNAEPITTKKRISKKERDRLDQIERQNRLDTHLKMLDKESMKRIKGA